MTNTNCFQFNEVSWIKRQETLTKIKKKNLPEIKELILSNTLYKIVLVSRNPSLNPVPVSPQGKNKSMFYPFERLLFSR